METLKRPEPLFRFGVITTETQIIIIFPGLYIKDMPGVKRRVLEAYLDITEDLVINGRASGILDGIQPGIGARLTLEKVHHNSYYDVFFTHLGKVFDGVLEHLIALAQETMRQTPEESDLEAYTKCRELLRKEFHHALESIVEAHALKFV